MDWRKKSVRHFKLRLLHLARAGSVRTCYDTRKHIESGAAPAPRVTQLHNITTSRLTIVYNTM